MKNAGDLDAVRLLVDVRDGRVEENQRDEEKRPRDSRVPATFAALPEVDDRGDARAGDEHQHAGGVGRALGIHVRLENQGDDEVDEREEQHERPHRARPLGGHAVARKVLRNEIQQPGHRACAREPQNHDGRDVVDRPEPLAEERKELAVRVFAVREIGECPVLGLQILVFDSRSVVPVRVGLA